ncbi:polyprenyl synthetase family protein [Saccharothrix xinjiangensis]|uniref:Polyprenyl synthetase family protein n=1 Tax=Saccharothrix xinjiangensis TaxID=204798 RepID=A0ABV9Y3H8_9PSEU
MALVSREHRVEASVLDDGLVPRLHRELEEFFAHAPDTAPEVGGALADLVLAGGKRVRPTFAWWGWRAAGGPVRGPAADATVRALVALELLQGGALVHDDVMDRSATRRGRPTVHTAFTARHHRGRWAGDPRHYGDSVAILVGDLALVWADDALAAAGLDTAALDRAREPWRAMRTEMIAGQHLDLLAGARRDESLEKALRVARLKTAAYTVERPLHLGAALAGAPQELVDALRSYGRDVGVAFQLRDDLLGVFGDTGITGKPVGDDLREGKRTALMALALGLARTARRPHAARLLRDCLEGGGVSDRTVDEVGELLRDLGAVDAVEERIHVLAEQALLTIDGAGLDEPVRLALGALAAKATERRW